MTKKEIVLWIVLADFVALTGYTFSTEGLVAGFSIALDFAAGSAWGLQVLTDFALALGIGLLFVVPDAQSRGLRAWPFVALTLTLGSIGLLSYLIYRERASRPLRELQEAMPQHT